MQKRRGTVVVSGSSALPPSGPPVRVLPGLTSSIQMIEEPSMSHFLRCICCIFFAYQSARPPKAEFGLWPASGPAERAGRDEAPRPAGAALFSSNDAVGSIVAAMSSISRLLAWGSELWE